MDFKLWLSILDYEHMTREKIAEAAWNAATTAEREACANVCEQLALTTGIDLIAANGCAAAIRSRSNAADQPK